MNYTLLLSSLYLYWKYSNYYNSMNEYENLFKICNNSLEQENMNIDDNKMSSIIVVVGNHMRRCLMPNNFISKCF